MKPLLQLLGNLVFAVSTILGIFLVAANASTPEPEPHRFQGLYTAGLWTSEPTRIDPASQTLERVAGPVVASAAASPDRKTAGATQAINSREVASLDPSAGMSSLEPADLNGVPAPASDGVDMALQAAHATWCMQHYRSYDSADNSYRSFSGERRVCRSPYVPANAAPPAHEATEIGAVATTPTADTAVSDDHARACMQRYRSYRIEDNSYQPFDGGPRRPCR